MAGKPSNQYLVLDLYTSPVPFVHKYRRWVAFCTDRPKSEKDGSFPSCTRHNPIWRLLPLPSSIHWLAFRLQPPDSLLNCLTGLFITLIRPFPPFFSFHSRLLLFPFEF